MPQWKLLKMWDHRFAKRVPTIYIPDVSGRLGNLLNILLGSSYAQIPQTLCVYLSSSIQLFKQTNIGLVVKHCTRRIHGVTYVGLDQLSAKTGPLVLIFKNASCHLTHRL